MYAISSASRRQRDRQINLKVEEHMREIYTVEQNDNLPNVHIPHDNLPNVRFSHGDLPNVHSPVAKKIKLISNSLIHDDHLSCQNLVEVSSESCSSDSSFETSQSDNNISHLLKDCFIKHNASHALINDVLKILKPYHSLPSDARTLLNTNQSSVSVVPVSNGEFAYFGLECGIKDKLKNGVRKNATKLNLLFNIDGLPLHKSSNKQFWPILCQIDEAIDRTPFPIAIFCGSSKPGNLDEFLITFVNELDSIIKGNACLEGFEVNVKAFVCDAPARAFLKCVKNHNGYYGCEKCKQKGEWINKMTFPDCDAPKRKDKDFYMHSTDNHILDRSPLLKLKLGLVTQFPLDYMHLVCLGVMKKLLISWCRGPLNVRLCSRDIDIISNSLTSLNASVPVELVRKPRSLREIDRWKATEFRMFLLYLGPVVLKKILPSDRYKHFLLLHVSIKILCSKDFINEYLPYAREYLNQFVEQSKSLYGNEFIVYNVHNLIHLADDVEKFGALDSFSCFPFENYLGKLKRLLRTPNKPLQQICRRIGERAQTSLKIELSISKYRVVKSTIHEEGPTTGLEGLQFKTAEKKGVSIKCNSNSNNCVILNDGNIVLVSNFVRCDKLMIIGRKFKSKSKFFSYPCESSLFDMFHVSKLSITFKSFPASIIKAKGILLPYRDQYVFSPLIHAVDN